MNLPINEIIGLVATVLAVIGVIANNRRLRVCFLLWLASNALTAGIHAHAEIWSLLLRDTVFFILAIEGWIKWGRK
jgi:nicotinamide riboside transporter PnuC